MHGCFFFLVSVLITPPLTGSSAPISFHNVCHVFTVWSVLLEDIQKDEGQMDAQMTHCALTLKVPRCIFGQSQCCVYVLVCVKGRGISHPGGPRCAAESHCCSLGSRSHSRGTSLLASPSLLCPASGACLSNTNMQTQTHRMSSQPENTGQTCQLRKKGPSCHFYHFVQWFQSKVEEVRYEEQSYYTLIQWTCH